MNEKKNLNKDELKNVAGGISKRAGFYYVIQYTNQYGYGDSYNDGPFESLEIAREKLEEKKNELVAKGCVIKNTQVVYCE